MSTLDNLQEIILNAIKAAPLGTGFGPAMEAALVKGHTAAVIAAQAERAGVSVNPDLFKGMSKATRAEIREAVQGQLNYLRGFLGEKDDLSEAQITARAAMYAGSVRATYGKARYPGLSQYPGDGGTQCLTNCKCDLTEADDGIHWNLNAGESCDDCQAMAAGSPYEAG